MAVSISICERPFITQAVCQVVSGLRENTGKQVWQGLKKINMSQENREDIHLLAIYHHHRRHVAKALLEPKFQREDIQPFAARTTAGDKGVIKLVVEHVNTQTVSEVVGELRVTDAGRIFIAEP